MFCDDCEDELLTAQEDTYNENMYEYYKEEGLLDGMIKRYVEQQEKTLRTKKNS